MKKTNNVIERIKLDIDKFSSEIDNVSFEMGLPGTALFYYYYYYYSGESKYKEVARELIKKTCLLLPSISKKEFQKKYRSDTIDNHLSGFGRFLIFTEEKLDAQLSFENILMELDEILYPLMVSKIKIKDFDLNSGALASGNYFLARYKQNKSNRTLQILTELIKGIEDNSIVHNSEQIYWSSPSLQNQVYLGLSHGSSMIINFLSKMIILNILPQKCSTIIKKAVQFLLSQKRNQLNGIFPHCFSKDRKEALEATQFSQCYGDLGVGYSLYVAGKALNDVKIIKEATLILNSCALRKKEDNLTEDASLVYGASGIACVFDNLYQISRNENFSKSSNYWFKQIPRYESNASRKEGHFSAFKKMINLNDINWEISFGWGLVGIGVSLMRFSSKKCPSFDELIMIGP